MRLLLDTHVALWAVGRSSKLSAKARELIVAAESDVFVSVASLWEIAVKHALKRKGQNAMKVSAAEAAQYFQQSGFDLLDVRREHVLALEALPMLHGDPFDRILIAQAMSEPMLLLSGDKRAGAYGQMVITV